MKIETIFENWKQDSEIDKTELADEAIKIPKLHHKYYMMYISERITLRQLKEEMKKLKLAKHEFYTQGPSEETKDLGWVYPDHMVLKSDAPMYIDSDKDIIDLNLRIGIQEEKSDLLSSIINSINNRGYQLKTALDYYRFTNGS